MRKQQKKANSTKLYDFDYESEEEKKLKAKRKKAEQKSASKKKKTKKELKSSNVEQGNKRKKYDDEIIIGVTRYPDKSVSETKKKKKDISKKEKKQKRRKNKKNIEQYNVRQNNNSQIKNKEKENVDYIKNKGKRNKTIKIVLLIILIGLALTFALLSPIFNIQNVEVLGNKQISQEELKSLSGIQINENIFKVSTLAVINNIKQNAYINEVQIHKKLPNTIQIKITEREPSYMLEYGNGYVYINNQGYMLEISSIKKDLAILTGISTSKEEYKEGNRLCETDLIKLGTVIKIMSAAKTNGIENLITKIDISDANNYTLYFETERKVAYLGDCSNLETRMLFLVGILNKEKENPGEIFINMNLNTDNAYFRESV